MVKLLIAVDAIDGPGPPRPDLDALVQRMLSYSDDSIANQLWVADGGPGIVSREIARIRLRETVPPANPGMWGATLFTAKDVARIYEYLLDEFPARPRAVMVAALRHSAPDGADGFYQHFGIPDGLAGTPWAVKQGW
ncbi:MAG TPA: hypothetical protein VHX59_25040 [Mycobacteriales bacterium]|nr:hypothetical protein [Mycobacteriales bacterium]